MQHNFRCYVVNAVYFIMLFVCVLYKSHFTYRVCESLNVKLPVQGVKLYS
jgi:hypothetical protein